MNDVKITRIGETKRGRFALFADEEFLFSVDAETLHKHKIQEGSSLSSEELSFLKDDSDARKAKDQALRYLSLRAYGENELYQKLCLKYDEPTSAAVLAALRELDLLNDQAYARDKARGLAARKKSGAEIRRRLLALGLEKSLVEAAVAGAVPPEADAETALAILRQNYMEKLRRGEKEKVMAALARRGFSHADIRRAVQAANAELAEADPPDTAW